MVSRHEPGCAEEDHVELLAAEMLLRKDIAAFPLNLVNLNVGIPDEIFPFANSQ